MIEHVGIARGVYYVVLQGRESINRATILAQKCLTAIPSLCESNG